MRFIKITLLISLFYFTTYCIGQENFKEYYYPIGTKKEVKVYTFVEKKNPKQIEYWKITTDPKTKTVLTESYTANFRLFRITKEKIKEEGTEIIQYTDFIKNNKGENIPIKSTVLKKDAYKWEDTNKYTYSIEYRNPFKGAEKLTRGRIKINNAPIIIEDITYESVKFMDQYIIKSLEYAETFAFYQKTYFAKGTGIIKFQRHFYETSSDFELQKIISEVAFHKLSKKAKK